MILITGSNSLLGQAILKKFVQKGEKVRCYDMYKPESLPKDVEFIQGDLFTFKKLISACKGVDTIIHLMDKSRSQKVGRRKMKKININGTLNLMIAAKRVNVTRFIFLSTYGVYGKTDSFPLKEEDRKKPYTPYGKDKLKAEQLCTAYAKKHNINLTIVRPSLIAGPGVRNTSILITLYLAMGLGNDNVMYMSGNGDTRFQLLDPEDAAEAFYKIYKAGKKSYGEIFNIGSDNVPTQMEQIVKIKETCKLDFAVKHITPIKAWLYSLLFKPSNVNYFTREHRLFIFHSVYLDCQKIKTLIGWHPKKDNIEILTETVKWYKEKLGNIKN
ncbi:MAG TPA: NAD(P)-dependent oxidoreductase [Spirochaetota bacterium]|nr:NAD(P)-dependent oxidoreductase [Spirochaetota bacterium]